MIHQPQHDVLIIGAGFSGLSAALTLQEAHKSVLVLEARDRVGGKSRSVQRADGKGVQELGACWVNDTNQSEVWRWCERLGLTAVVQNVKGKVAWEDEEGQRGWFDFGGLPEVRTDGNGGASGGGSFTESGG
jgi:monoamine oxidase